MKKIAFTLYMISLIIMFPLYVILEFNRESTPLNDLNPVSAKYEKIKIKGIEMINNSNG